MPLKINTSQQKSSGGVSDRCYFYKYFSDW